MISTRRSMYNAYMYVTLHITISLLSSCTVSIYLLPFLQIISQVLFSHFGEFKVLLNKHHFMLHAHCTLHTISSVSVVPIWQSHFVLRGWWWDRAHRGHAADMYAQVSVLIFILLLSICVCVGFRLSLVLFLDCCLFLVFIRFYLIWQRNLTNLHVNKCARNLIALHVAWDKLILDWDVVTTCSIRECVNKCYMFVARLKIGFARVDSETR